MAIEFADLYNTHFRRIAVQVHAYIGDLAEAQDLTQEAFCRALDRWNRISGYDDPAAWVRRVAMNLATSRHRRRRTVQRFLSRQREEYADGPSPDHVALVRALATLPEKHRKAVVQHYIGHMTTAEIAEDEGVAEGTVRSWLSRGRSELATHFSEFETASSAAVRPAGSDAVVAVVQRRKRNRTLAAIAAAIVAVAIAIPLTILNRDRDTPPDVTNTPTPTVSASPGAVPTFRISAPGVQLPVTEVMFVDARNGWAYFSACDNVVCAADLASTSDGGRTWRRTTLPEIPGIYSATLHPLNATAAALLVQSGQTRSFLLTKDGGSTFTSHAFTEPPLEVLQAAPGGPGRFRVLCPGETGYEGGPGTPCLYDLVKIGSGPVTPRPQLLQEAAGKGASLAQGANGRLWLTVLGSPQMRIAYSDDEGKSWHEVDRWGNGYLSVSADGKDAWISDGGKPVRLFDDSWETPGYIPAGTTFSSGFMTVGDGVIVGVVDGVMTFYTADGVRKVEQFRTDGLEQLADGTLFSRKDNIIYLGTGTGADRQWTAVTW